MVGKSLLGMAPTLAALHADGGGHGVPIDVGLTREVGDHGEDELDVRGARGFAVDSRSIAVAGSDLSGGARVLSGRRHFGACFSEKQPSAGHSPLSDVAYND